MHNSAAHCFPSHQPPQACPWVITGHSSSIGAGTHRQPHLQHSTNQRLAFDGFDAISADEILALVSHAMLDRNTAAKSGDTFHVRFRDRFAMIDEPPQIVNRKVAMNAFEDIE